MKYFDAHAHTQFPQYDEDREAVLAVMSEQGVGAVMVGVDRESSEKAVELVAGRENLYASVGIHPNRADEQFDMDSWRTLASNEKVIAIGECGLDYYRPEDAETAKVLQKELFLKHLALAVELDKPLIIHPRPSKGTQDAYRDLIDILRVEKEKHGERLRGDSHFFVGGVQEAHDLIALGFTISFTAVITFARDYDEVIRSVPLTSILAETDSPYLAPEGRRGQRNDPLATIDVVRKIAQIRGEDEEMVRETLLQNVKRLFRI